MKLVLELDNNAFQYFCARQAGHYKEPPSEYRTLLPSFCLLGRSFLMLSLLCPSTILILRHFLVARVSAYYITLQFASLATSELYLSTFFPF